MPTGPDVRRRDAMSLRWLPNAISLLRIGLILPILYSVVTERYTIALAMFVFAALSDGLDGWLAKHFGWHSRFGALLDPIADKLLVAGMFVTLYVGDFIPLWLAAVVILRDVVIIGGATA